MDEPCSEFLKSMIHWQLIESSEFGSIVDAEQSILSVIKSNWDQTSQSERGGPVYSQPGQWLAVLELGDNLELHVGAATEELLDDMGQKLGIPLERF